MHNPLKSSHVRAEANVEEREASLLRATDGVSVMRTERQPGVESHSAVHCVGELTCEWAAVGVSQT